MNPSYGWSGAGGYWGKKPGFSTRYTEDSIEGENIHPYRNK